MSSVSQPISSMHICSLDFLLAETRNGHLITTRDLYSHLAEDRRTLQGLETRLSNKNTEIASLRHTIDCLLWASWCAGDATGIMLYQ